MAFAIQFGSWFPRATLFWSQSMNGLFQKLVIKMQNCILIRTLIFSLCVPHFRVSGLWSLLNDHERTSKFHKLHWCSTYPERNFMFCKTGPCTLMWRIFCCFIGDILFISVLLSARCIITAAKQTSAILHLIEIIHWMNISIYIVLSRLLIIRIRTNPDIVQTFRYCILAVSSSIFWTLITSFIAVLEFHDSRCFIRLLK